MTVGRRVPVAGLAHSGLEGRVLVLAAERGAALRAVLTRVLPVGIGERGDTHARAPAA